MEPLIKLFIDVLVDCVCKRTKRLKQDTNRKKKQESNPSGLIIWYFPLYKHTNGTIWLKLLGVIK